MGPPRRFYSTLQASPSQVAFGRVIVTTSTHLTNWCYIITNREKQTLRNNLRENSKRINYDYKVNGKVLITNDSTLRRKLDKPLESFRIIQVHVNGNIIIQSCTSDNVAHR